MTQLEKLKALIEGGRFHHATYRCLGTVWEGLWYYQSDREGFRGYAVAGCVSASDPDLEKAYACLTGHGVHVGSYGHG